jgi:hypothetical protein
MIRDEASMDRLPITAAQCFDGFAGMSGVIIDDPSIRPRETNAVAAVVVSERFRGNVFGLGFFVESRPSDSVNKRPRSAHIGSPSVV